MQAESAKIIPKFIQKKSIQFDSSLGPFIAKIKRYKRFFRVAIKFYDLSSFAYIATINLVLHSVMLSLVQLGPSL